MDSFLDASSDLTRQPFSSVPAKNVGISGTCKRKRAGVDDGSLPTSDSYPPTTKRQNYVYGCHKNTVKGSREGFSRDGSVREESGDEESSDENGRNESSGEKSSDEKSSDEEGRGSLRICSHVSQGVHAHDLTTDKNLSIRATKPLQIPTLSLPLNAPQSQLTKQCFRRSPQMRTERGKTPSTSQVANDISCTPQTIV